jgi:hypothetical protein
MVPSIISRHVACPTLRMAREQALELMLGFAERTGLISDRPPDRYLWTDAFAAANFLGLGRTDLATALVDQVHAVLGRHRDDDSRRGPISGLSDVEAETHPTAGGLRIGKRLPERGSAEPIDERAEWDRDGQYFHYLSRWMHALDLLARRTGDVRHARWARELAAATHRAFVRDGRLAWKLSIDLTRPLVTAMGQHDPLDGYVTCLQLTATAAALGNRDPPHLDEAADDFGAMIPAGAGLATADPLGIGGLLTDAWRIEQLRRVDRPGSPRLEKLGEEVVAAAASGLERYAGSGELEAAASWRLAFRELGLAIGLARAEQLGDARLEAFAELRTIINRFWALPEHQARAGWRDHRNINEVMLATSLAPGGYLTLVDPAG